jgi:lipopolysaccharide biosynthesis protein
MMLSEPFLQISEIEGVDEYIFTDNQGNIAAHDMVDPQKVSGMVWACGRDIRAIGRDKFKYAVFSRNNKRDIIIFPVGNYLLGVVKQDKTETLVLVECVLKFLQGLLGKKVIYKREDP